MPKSVTILPLLLANTGSGNFKSRSPGSIAAVFQSLGNKMSNLSVTSSKMLSFWYRAPFIGSAQQNISLFCLLLILTVKNRLAQLAGKCSPLNLRSTFLYKFVSYVQSKIWNIRHVWVFLMNSVTHVSTSLLVLGLEGPFWLLLPARSWIRSFSAVRVTILDVFLQPSTTPAYAVCRHWILTNVFWIHLLSHRPAYLCHWWWCQAKWHKANDA